MNERIRQLSDQAYDELVKETGNIVVVDEDFQQRFAQLIVRECADVGALGQSCTDSDLIKRGVLAHFGVE